MSVDEDTAKMGSPQPTSTSSPQLTDCTGGYCDVSAMIDGTAATPEFAAACPLPGTAASPKHTSTTDALTLADNAGQRARGNENSINRRNSFHHSKQQQQQTKLTKRRYTANSGFKHPSSGKRRRRANSESDSVLPTNFLLGGNIFDPLNLNSLLDEEVNRALNAETPKSSPLPAKSRDPVEILIPRDITDPLNLNSGIADSSFLVSPFKSGGRKRHRNRHHGGGGSGSVKTGPSMPLQGTLASCSALESNNESSSVSSVIVEFHEHTDCNSASCKEEATSVSVEDSASSLSGAPHQHTGRRKRRRNSGGARNSFQTSKTGPKTGPGIRQHPQPHSHTNQQKKFQYGNYNKYYGYRNPGCSEDPRVRLLRPEWFKGKEVLDLGCNSGHVTLYIAKMLRPARILGLDIDSGLIHAARKNIRHYLSELQTQEARRSCSFPVSLRISRGPIAAPPLTETSKVQPGEFPSNVSFIKANYVLENDNLLLTQRPEYDVILCLSVTKWVHLNWGDSGLKRLFKRVYRHLHPGGLFILEPQPWESYVRRKKLTDNISRNYHSIHLKPDQFSSYLTTEVGFTSFEYIGAPKCSVRGFQRPIYVFHK
uniref:RNA methyltransferase n=1 Tax=Amphilophus citrinellus TaxID=61819 RepID=A0A3Q0RTS5_AMPCI